MEWQEFPTIKLLIEAAKELKVKYQIIGKTGFVKFSHKKKSAFIYRTRTPLNNQVGILLSASKYLTSKILDSYRLPTQRYYFCHSIAIAKRKARQIGFPLVVKPNIGSEGRGVTADINSKNELTNALNLAFRVHPKIILSPYFPGEDYRLLVLQNKLIGAIKREPPRITGDGQTKIEDLIAQENQKRKELNKGFIRLVQIKIDKEVKRQIKKEGLTLESILAKGKTLPLRANANWSTGGTVETLEPESLHPTIIWTAIKATRALTLNYAAVDFILKNPKLPIKNNGIILEVNTYPGIGIFHYPSTGKPQKVAPIILKAILS